MKVEFTKSFAKDLRKNARDKQLLDRIRSVIEGVEGAESLNDISNLRKLTADGICYRVRVGDYRIGMVVENEVVTFVRVLHRREIYRYFP